MTPSVLHRTLAGLALGAGLLAAFVGNPTPAPQAAGALRLAPADLASLAARIEAEEDHVTATEVALWLRARRPRLRIVDLRPPEEFAAGHLPGAENQALRELVAAAFAPDEKVVLVSAGGAHAAQGWVLLAARGVRDVHTLAGGYDVWLREVMYPEIPRNADPQAQAAFAHLSELSRYFGGRPRIVDAAPAAGVAGGVGAPAPELPSEELARRVARTRRGGC